MNRYERHLLDTSGIGRRRDPLCFDACQLQLIIRANGYRDYGECAAWSLGDAIARHMHRQTVVRYHDAVRRQRDPLNPKLTQRLRDWAWDKLKPRSLKEFWNALGHSCPRDVVV